MLYLRVARNKTDASERICKCGFGLAATISLDRISSLHVLLLCSLELADTHTVVHSNDSGQFMSHAGKESFKLACNLNYSVHKLSCVCVFMKRAYLLQEPYSVWVISLAPSALVASISAAIHIKIYCLIRPMSM